MSLIVAERKSRFTNIYITDKKGSGQLSADELPDDAPATNLFPQFNNQLYQMISGEVHDLTDAQLDFESERWEWSKWNIRRNLSHMASGVCRWFWSRWG